MYRPIIKILLAPLVVAGIALLFLAAMLLWNALMPEIFNLPVLSYWQAAGLLVLARLFFGFGGKHHSHFPRRPTMHDKWKKMSSEEREEFIKKVRARKHNWGEPCPEMIKKEEENPPAS